jgi:hypothetical protein
MSSINDFIKGEKEFQTFKLFECLLLVVVTNKTPNDFLNYLDKLGCKAKVVLGKW